MWKRSHQAANPIFSEYVNPMMTDIDPTFFEHASTSAQWKKIGIKNHHGFVIPLFSLHSKQSYGIGEYLDLLPVIDWCASLGYDIIQLLPLNDTGLDPSPYSALSANALNPIHISLSSLPYIDQHPILQEALKAVPKMPHSNKVHYPTVRDGKHHFLTLYYQTVGKQIIESKDYQTFALETTWLKNYAIFKTLKVTHQWKDWELWPEEHQNPTSELLRQISQQYADAIAYHSLLQFLSHQQLLQVNSHAKEKKVFLMGDIPILIGRDSVDVWLHRDLFDLNYSAGAPPDQFSANGQKWGFPIYNWENIAKEGYAWWIERLQTASQYYQIYRIDHIVGLFRIWAVPLDRQSIEGFFIPQDSSAWIDHGQKILLMMINNCSMLPIGEDLGTIPPIVRTCLHALGICGTKVIRWERYWDSCRSFIPLEDYHLASMTTVSTHDSETLALWWKYNPHETKAFADFKGWCYHPVLSRAYHQEILWDSHHSNSLFHINLLQEYFSLVPGLNWPTLEEERINQPGFVSDDNWSYRYKPSIEEIVENQSLSHVLKEMLL